MLSSSLAFRWGMSQLWVTCESLWVYLWVRHVTSALMSIPRLRSMGLWCLKAILRSLGIGFNFPMSIFDKYSQVFCYFSGKIHSKLILRSSMILNLGWFRFMGKILTGFPTSKPIMTHEWPRVVTCLAWHSPWHSLLSSQVWSSAKTNATKCW